MRQDVAVGGPRARHRPVRRIPAIRTCSGVRVPRELSIAKRLFPEALDVVESVTKWGAALILSDGDVVFQPRKVERACILAAVDGNVLIYPHKELELEDVQQRFPAKHYVLVDDKLRILTAVKNVWGNRVTTVFARQGHYALDLQALSKYPSADITIERVGDLLEIDVRALLAAARKAA